MTESCLRAGALSLMLLAGSAQAQVNVDEHLPDYQAIDQPLSGVITSVGSDAMNNLMTLWGEGFEKHYPKVKIQIRGQGASTAPHALIQGIADFGPMSSEWPPQLRKEFEQKYGHAPTRITTAMDILAVYVHRDNPLKGLTLPQVDATFSSTRKLGHSADITTWGQLGLTNDWKQAGVALHGRYSATYNYGHFQWTALGRGNFKEGVKEHPRSAEIVEAVARDRFAIGYCGSRYQSARVRALPLASQVDSDPVAPTLENAFSGKYPLARPLTLNFNLKLKTEIDPLRREFLRYVFSRQGQQAVVLDGYTPVNAKIARDALELVGIKPKF